MYEIIIGRSDKDKEKFGTKGTIFIGKHYVRMGQTTSLSNPILMDVIRSHVIFVCGKRGSGKSFSMGVIAEGMCLLPQEVSNNLAIVILDTMGIYWTMKFKNEKEKDILKEWDIEPQALPVRVFTPKGYFKQYLERGVPTDYPFSIRPSELDSIDWCRTFGVSENDALGVFIEKIINELKEKNADYSLDDITNKIKEDNDTDRIIKAAAENRFSNAKEWGLFDKEGTRMSDLVKRGSITIIDTSCYVTTPGAKDIRSLVIGLVAEKMFVERLVARKREELEDVKRVVEYEEETQEEKEVPLIWLIIDEAHEFLPNDRETVASAPLITILREGREPGISLILASQQPGKIHTDVMTQSDIVIAHRLTAKIDTDALKTLMQSYMRQGLDRELDNLPRVAGAAIILDDMNERLYQMKIRPRITWHGGSAPTAIKETRKVYEI